MNLFKKAKYSDPNITFYYVNDKKLYIIPDNLINFYEDGVYLNGFCFVSENIINDEQVLFICLLNDLKVWKKKLRHIFKEKDIIKLFNEFNNRTLCVGTYCNGYIIIINSDYFEEFWDVRSNVMNGLNKVFHLFHLFKD